MREFPTKRRDLTPNRDAPFWRGLTTAFRERCRSQGVLEAHEACGTLLSRGFVRAAVWDKETCGRRHQAMRIKPLVG